MKKVLSVILSIFMLLSISAGFDFSAYALSSSGSCGTNVTYTFDSSTGKLTISGSGAMSDYNYSDSSFYNQSSIKTVVINNGVTSIGKHAFNSCSGLISIEIPDSVTSIGDSAFSSCSGLTSVEIGNSVTSIGSSAFRGCSGLTSIEIPDSVTYIGASAFSGCSGLTSIEIPNSVTSIGSYAFYYCSSLTSVTIGNSVTIIGDYAFFDCSGLTSVTIPDSVTSISNYAFYNCSGIKELTMPCSAKIYNSSNTFNGCSNIETVTLTKGTGIMQNYGTSSSSSATNTYYGYTPWYISREKCKEIILEDGIKHIGSYVFYNCSGLTSVTIPNSVTSIGSFAFSGCSKLENIYTNDIEYWITKSFGNEFPNKYSLYVNNELITDLVIPSSVSNIENYALYNCSSLTSVEIPNSVTSIGDYAFRGCNSFTNIKVDSKNAVYDSRNNCNAIIKTDSNELILGCISTTIPNSVTSIGNYAFSDCSGLTSIEIPDSVSSIGNYAFNNCSGIKELTIPCSAKIYYYTFYNCSNIEKATLTKGSGTMQNYSFSSGQTDTYYQCTPWYISRDSIKDINLEDGIENIGSYAFPYCSGLSSIEIPNSVTSIGDYAFSGCRGLTSIEIPNSVTSIGNNVFSSCGNLISVEIPDSVTSIGDNAFSGCGLRNIDIPNSISNIGEYAFALCEGLKSVVIPNSVTNIGNNAFQGCSRLISITIPESVTSIGNNAFYNCGKLSNVYYTGSESDWSNISIGSNNFDLIYSTINYDYVPPCEEHIPATAVIENEVAATCTSKGSYDEVIYCEVCGAELSREKKYTERAAHTPDEAVIEKVNAATCFAKGTYDNVVYCAVCDKELSRETVFTDKLDHTPETDEAVAPSCTKAGWSEGSHCSVCGKVLTAQEVVKANGHSYEAVVTEPTCLSRGYTTYTCTVCGDSYRGDYVAASDEHEYRSAVTKLPTCSELGVRTYTCTICGDKYVEDVEMLEHTPVKDKAVAATFSAAGKTEGSHCKVCGKVLVEQKTVAKLGAPTISGLTAQSKGFKVTWKSVANIDGYEIRYATSTSALSKAKPVAVSGYKSTSKTITKLTGKKKYYVQIRAYKTINGKKQYSAWSANKPITTKK